MLRDVWERISERPGQQAVAVNKTISLRPQFFSESQVLEAIKTHLGKASGHLYDQWLG